MTTRSHTPPRQRPAPRLYLLAPPVAAGAGSADALSAALAAADVAAVLLRLPEPDDRGRINAAKALAPLVQRSGAALLLDGNAALVARAGADGAHLTGIAALHASLPGLKPDRIVGAGGLLTRHDAMLAGEAGADYVMFGEPDAHGVRPSFDDVAERVGWWAELFEPPCVGFAGSLEEVGALAAAGADFVVLGDWLWSAPGMAATIAAEATRRLQPAEVTG
jgi:thiamine-phosphate pyrophosphorylase